MVTANTFKSRSDSLQAAENVAAADHDGHLGAGLYHTCYLTGKRAHHLFVKTFSGGACKGLAAEFEKDSVVFHCVKYCVLS